MGGSAAAAAGVLAAAGRQLGDAGRCGHGGWCAGSGNQLGQASVRAKTRRAGCAAAAPAAVAVTAATGGVGTGGPSATLPLAVAPLRAWTDAGAPGHAIRGGGGWWSRWPAFAASCSPLPAPLTFPAVRGVSRSGRRWRAARRGLVSARGWRLALHRSAGAHAGVGRPATRRTTWLGMPNRVGYCGGPCASAWRCGAPPTLGWCSLAVASLYHIYYTVSLALVVSVRLRVVVTCSSLGDLFPRGSPLPSLVTSFPAGNRFPRVTSCRHG